MAVEEERKTRAHTACLGHPAERSNPRPRYKTGTWGTRRKEELVDGEDDFAEMLGFFEIVVRGGAFVEGPDLVHDGNEAALGNEIEDGAQFVLGAHVGAENGKLAGEEETDIEFGVVTGGGAAGDQAAGGG